MGITRLANVTGLDCIGIPVVMSCRPNARSLSVSQGKGFDLDAARASALMEAVELFHAEHVLSSLRLGRVEELRYTHSLVDVTELPRRPGVALDLSRSILWIEGVELTSPDVLRVWVPYESVHVNYTSITLPSTECLARSSSGLSSGNHLLEAVAHGLYELIERDSVALFFMATEEERASRRVDLDSIDDPLCRQLIERYRSADVLVGVWETTADVRVPVFSATICDRDRASPRALYAASGHGCHPARNVALLRALTEAAQSRLTYISGARDDAFRATYRHAQRFDSIDFLRAELAKRGARSFSQAPSLEAPTLNDELQFAVDALAKAGFVRVIFVDLTRPDFGIPVVRVLTPGLEADLDQSSAVPGSRAFQRLERAFAS